MRKAIFGISFLFLLFLLASCTRSTGPLYRDGRIFAKLDSPSSRCEMRYLKITVEVEGYEPFVTRIFDFEDRRASEYMQAIGIKTRKDALNWNDYYNKKLIDLTGRLIPGGRQVTVTVSQPMAHAQTATAPSFRLDGNAIFRIYYAGSTGQVHRLHIERIQ